MELPTVDYSDAYIEVCKKANLPINKMPKCKEDLTLAYEMAMKEFNPHLYQNITSPDPDELPVDVAQRYKQGTMWTSDLQAYEKNGFTGTAANIRKEMGQAMDIIIAQRTAEMKARNDKHQQDMLDKPKGMQYMPPLPQEQVQHFRDQVGYTGLADWQKG